MSSAPSARMEGREGSKWKGCGGNVGRSTLPAYVRPMRLARVFLILVSIPFASERLLAQEAQGEHEHAPNELGMANSAVHFPREAVWSYGLHLHYLRTIDRSRFRLGAGFERIFDHHRHNTIGLVGGYALAHGLTFLISPGIT